MSIDDFVLGCCAACKKERLQNAHNWRALSQERASQLTVDFEKANTAAGAGFMGVDRLCYMCRAECNKPEHSGRNGKVFATRRSEGPYVTGAV